MQVIKVVIDYSGGEDTMYLPLEENLKKESLETFAELKKKWESLEWGYYYKPEVTLVEALSEKEFAAYNRDTPVDMFPDLPKTEPLVLDINNPSEVLECEELEIICFKELMAESQFYSTPYSEKPQPDFYSGIFAIDCKRGQVYSKDFAYFNCECCNREICEQNPANGWMVQYKNMDEDGYEKYCNKCFEEETLKGGLDIDEVLECKTIKGLYSSDSELEEAGFCKLHDEKLVGHGYSGYADPEDFWKMLQKDYDEGTLKVKGIVFQLGSMAIGGMGGYVSVWYKEKEVELKT